MQTYPIPILLYFFAALVLLGLGACKSGKEQLQGVSVAQFRTFVEQSNYVTDAEKYGWSIVQLNVFQFETRDSVDWRNPRGEAPASPNFPVTQVSYNDALAYCEWAGVRLPTYEEYWIKVAKDKNPIITNDLQIYPLNQVNIVGNTWDITATKNSNKELRLAGGSYLCNKNTCDGASRDRILFVDKTTGNSHISFSVIVD